jgi:hypothetical protein
MKRMNINVHYPDRQAHAAFKLMMAHIYVTLKRRGTCLPVYNTKPF